MLLPQDQPSVGMLTKVSSPKVPTNSPWKDPRTALFYLSVASVGVLVLPPAFTVIARLVNYLRSKFIAYRARQHDGEDETSPLLGSTEAGVVDEETTLLPPPRAPSRVLPVGSGSLIGDLKLHVAAVGGRTVFLLNLVRLLSCLALVGLTLWAIVIDAEDSADPKAGGAGLVEVFKKGGKKGKWRKGRKGERRREAFGREEWVEIGQCFFYLYCAVLSLVALTIPRLRVLRSHLTLLLAAAFCLSAYRNLLPLIFGRKPLDIVLHHLKGVHDPAWDALIWLRVGLLALAGVAVPLALLAGSASAQHALAHNPLSFFLTRADEAPETDSER